MNKPRWVGSQKYGAIIVDPPWTFKARSAKGLGKSPQAHYECMSLVDILTLPVGTAALPSSMCFLWITAPFLNVGGDVLSAWGFTFKTAGAWAKRTKHGKPGFGTGFLLRSAAEFWMVGTRGNPPINSRSVRNLIDAPLREHSRKPDALYGMVEALTAGPYLELFATRRRKGWTTWGKPHKSEGKN